MRHFGEIEGIEVDQNFINRIALAEAKVHPPTQAGISGSGKEGADSIVLSGGYEDDEDFGHEIIYTGAGGRDENTGKQTSDQELTRTNLALAKNKLEGLPVRVTRSHKHDSQYSPKIGYSYGGLYFVDDYWREKGLSGHYIWRFRLTSSSVVNRRNAIQDEPPIHGDTERKTTVVQRIVRDRAKAKKIKLLHNYQCQVCGVALEMSTGLYAEAAHIKPLGRPHDGPDIESNILCLCPNHHVLFDNGGFTINDDLSIEGILGKLRTVPKHKIDVNFISYHREHYSKSY